MTIAAPESCWFEPSQHNHQHTCHFKVGAHSAVIQSKHTWSNTLRCVMLYAYLKLNTYALLKPWNPLIPVHQRESPGVFKPSAVFLGALYINFSSFTCFYKSQPFWQVTLQHDPLNILPKGPHALIFFLASDIYCNSELQAMPWNKKYHMPLQQALLLREVFQHPSFQADFNNFWDGLSGRYVHIDTIRHRDCPNTGNQSKTKRRTCSFLRKPT